MTQQDDLAIVAVELREGLLKTPLQFAPDRLCGRSECLIPKLCGQVERGLVLECRRAWLAVQRPFTIERSLGGIAMLG